MPNDGVEASEGDAPVCNPFWPVTENRAPGWVTVGVAGAVYVGAAAVKLPTGEAELGCGVCTQLLFGG